MDPTIKRLITHYKKEGFRIKIPGGNERNDTYAAFCSTIRYNFYQSKWQIVCLPWRPRTEKEEQQKREEKYPEDPKAAVAREVSEETGVLLLEYFLLDEREIKDKRPDHIGEMHSQYLYACIRQYDASNLRHRPSHSQPNIDTPFWCDIDDELEREISIEHLWMIQSTRRYVDQLPIPKKRFKPFHSGKEKKVEPELV